MMRIGTFQKQTQKGILAPVMQQSIAILMLPSAELELAVEQEIQENPLLEKAEDPQKEESASQAEEYLLGNLKNLSSDYKPQSYDISEDEPEEKLIANTKSLDEYLLQQLQLEITNKQEIEIGEFIIGDLDENGYLKTDCPKIAEIFRIPLATVEKILNTIQNFEPSGIAARNLKECLLNQAKFRFNGSETLVVTILKNHLDALGKRKYTEIAKACHITEERVKEITQLIATLEPKPARKHQPVDGNIYIKPDITVYKDDTKTFQVRINCEYFPKLRINKTYQRLLEKPNLSAEESEYIRGKIKNALFFIKSIEQRNETIKRISDHILHFQKDFFESGPSALRPMTLKDVAQNIERNESTVCRAINHKYIETPYGLFALKYFFSQAIANNENTGEGTSNRCIKEELKELIADESKTKPLSDQQIVEHFKNKNIPIARRTIAKYRKQMHILPSNLRKE